MVFEVEPEEGWRFWLIIGLIAAVVYTITLPVRWVGERLLYGCEHRSIQPRRQLPNANPNRPVPPKTGFSLFNDHMK